MNCSSFMFLILKAGKHVALARTYSFSFSGLISSFDISNLKPMFQSNTTDYLSGINSYYAFHIVPMFLITMIPKNSVEKPKFKKTLIISTIISSISMSAVIFATLSTLGYQLTALYEYPEFHVLKQATIVGASSRIESILVIQLIFDIFIYCTLIIYMFGNNIKEIFQFKKINYIYLFGCILIIIGTIFAAKYNIYVDNLMINIIPIISTIFTLSVTLITYFKIIFSKKKKTS